LPRPTEQLHNLIQNSRIRIWDFTKPFNRARELSLSLVNNCLSDGNLFISRREFLRPGERFLRRFDIAKTQPNNSEICPNRRFLWNLRRKIREYRAGAFVLFHIQRGDPHIKCVDDLSGEILLCRLRSLFAAAHQRKQHREEPEPARLPTTA
jgi:hypothetical protein